MKIPLSIGGIKANYDNLDKVADLDFRGATTISKKLQTLRQDAELSFQLATIKTDVDLDIRCRVNQYGVS